MTNETSAKFMTLLFFLLMLLFACRDKPVKPENEDNPDSSITISSDMSGGNTFPASVILDSLIRKSHVQLILSSCYSDTGDADYPEIIYIADNVVKTFAFVWLPGNWNSFPDKSKRMIVHLHGHCGIGTKHFCKWYELAREKNIAVLSLQYWMGEDEWGGGNPKPDGDYSYYLTGPGQTCGWHLNIETDIYPFIDKLAEYYDVHSVMLHGFSMAAATSAIVNYRDKYNRNVIDFTVFDAGHIDPNHYFYQEIESGSNDSPFEDENYFFFLESFDANTYPQQSSTRSFLIENGVTDIETVIAEGSDYKHGALLNNEDFFPVRERIVTLYDSLTAD